MRTIDADELIPLIKMGEMNTYDELGQGRNGGIDFAIERIKQMPTIEPERKKGEWIPVDDREVPYGLLFKCSECGTEVIVNDALEHSYCSECGADMRGEE